MACLQSGQPGLADSGAGQQAGAASIARHRQLHPQIRCRQGRTGPFRPFHQPQRGGRIVQAQEIQFRRIAEREGDRVRLIDASATPESVTERLIEALADLLP